MAANMLPALAEDQVVNLRANVLKVQGALHEEPTQNHCGCPRKRLPREPAATPRAPKQPSGEKPSAKQKQRRCHQLPTRNAKRTQSAEVVWYKVVCERLRVCVYATKLCVKDCEVWDKVVCVYV